MSISNGYATLAEYKSWIALRGLSGDTTTDTSDDSVIEIIIESVSRYIDRETGRRFYPDTSNTDYYYQAAEAYQMDLPDFASIATVSVDYNNTRTYTALTASDWEALPDNYSAEGLPIRGLAILPTSSAYFPIQRRGVKINGKRGWLVAPTDIKDAALAITHNLYSQRAGQPASGRVSVTAGGVVIRPEDVPPYAAQTIKHYRMMT